MQTTMVKEVSRHEWVDSIDRLKHLGDFSWRGTGTAIIIYIDRTTME